MATQGTSGQPLFPAGFSGGLPLATRVRGVLWVSIVRFADRSDGSALVEGNAGVGGASSLDCNVGGDVHLLTGSQVVRDIRGGEGGVS